MLDVSLKTVSVERAVGHIESRILFRISRLISWHWFIPSIPISTCRSSVTKVEEGAPRGGVSENVRNILHSRSTDYFDGKSESCERRQYGIELIHKKR